jgi:MFS family permease
MVHRPLARIRELRKMSNQAIPAPAGAMLTVDRRQQLPVQVLWVTTLISMFGNSLTAIAVPWFVLELSGSASRTGLTAAVTLVPVVIASFLGGALVDRTDYRLLSVFSDSISAITVAAVPFFYLTTGLSFPGLLMLMFLGAIFDAPGSTARTAMVPPLSKITGIPLERINANFGMVRAISALFSAPLAGLLVAWLGPMHVLWFNAGAFIISGLAVMLFIPRLPRPEPTGDSFVTDVRGGLAYVRHDPTLLALVAGALAINFLFAPIFGVMIPYLANQELHSARALGVMFGGEGLGALAGSWIYGRFAGRLRRHQFLTIALVLLATPVIPLAFARDVWTATACIVVFGIGSGLVNPMLGTFVQHTTPSSHMGRVMGVIQGGALVAQPAGLLLGGPLIVIGGLTGAIITIGVGVMVISAWLAVAPGLRALDRTSD